MKSRFLLAAFAAATVLGVSAIAGADTVGAPSLTINGWTPSLAQLGCTTDGLISTCSGGGGLSRPNNDFTLTSWNVSLDADPSVNGSIAVTNNLLSTQVFVLTYLLPIVPQGPQVQVNGSIAGSLTDNQGNNAVLADIGSPIYQAKIDGVTVQPLLSPVQNVSTTTSTFWGPGVFGPTVLNQTANSNIAIVVSFSLSPGDSASFTSVFNLIAVPEPGTLLLMGGGLLGLVGYSRRYTRA